MNQLYLRKLHKTIGIVLAFFIFLQAGSGLLLSFSVSHSHAHTDAVIVPDKQVEKSDIMSKEKDIQVGKDLAVEKSKTSPVHNHEDEPSTHQGILQRVHHGGGSLGSIYRILLAAGFLFMALSGSLIFYLPRKAMNS